MLRPARLNHVLWFDLLTLIHVLWFDLLTLIHVLQLTNRSSATEGTSFEFFKKENGRWLEFPVLSVVEVSPPTNE